MRGIRKSFSGVPVLNGVDFTVWPGEVHALMGENGAGKSTLMKILAGALSADAGEIRLDGRPFTASNPAQVLRAGIAVIHQELCMAPNLTVAENIFLGSELRRGWGLDRRRMEAEADELLARLGGGFSPRVRAGRLSVAEQQLVEIARALRHRSRVLVMDEPTAALSEHEAKQLFASIAQLRESGTAIVYISHRMAEVQQLADRVTVLRDGSAVGTLEKSEIEPGQVVQLMVGRPLQDISPRTRRRGPAQIVLRVGGLGDGRRIRAVDLEVRAGEVVGLAGLVAGRTEVARLICGADRKTAGTIELEGRVVAITSPAKALAAGIVYVTEDRKGQGLFLDLAAQLNLTINLLAPTARAGLLNFRELNRRGAADAAAFQVQSGVLNRPARLLSGGNQQKLLLGRALSTRPKLLVLDEPTRGVDIGAKLEIYRMIDHWATQGLAILLISSELAEIIALSDRVLVMREGQMVGSLDRARNEVTPGAIGALATGA